MQITKKTRKKRQVDRLFLDEILKLKEEWMSLKAIIDRSVDATEDGKFDLAVAEVKYFYLLREARSRKISALR